MNTNRPFTSGTSPFSLFVLYKISYTEIFNIYKILDHAHVVFGSISCVQMVQKITGEISAFKTMLCAAAPKNVAVLNFTSNASDWFICIRFSATGTFIFLSQIRHTNTTVHSAGSYKRIFIQGFNSSTPMELE
jgi:hypothetical protein